MPWSYSQTETSQSIAGSAQQLVDENLHSVAKENAQYVFFKRVLYH